VKGRKGDLLQLTERGEAFDDWLRCIIRLATMVSARHYDRLVQATIFIERKGFSTCGCRVMTEIDVYRLVVLLGQSWGEV
jgi:hypothetical protein